MDNLLVDARGVSSPAPDGTVVGRRKVVPSRMVWAFPVSGGGLSRRYGLFAPGESSLFGMDFSFLLLPGTAISFASLAVFTNTFVPAFAPEWLVGPVAIEGSVVYARLTGGTEGVDYQMRWSVQDTEGNVFPRTALVLCSLTS